MTPLTLHDLCDADILSEALHQMLLALRRSSLDLSAARLCRQIGMHHSEIARMRWLHRRPAYAPLVSKMHLRRLVTYLMEQFPSLVVYRNSAGRLRARLNKYAGCRRCEYVLEALPPLYAAGRRVCRPGTTRWFIEHMA